MGEGLEGGVPSFGGQGGEVEVVGLLLVLGSVRLPFRGGGKTQLVEEELGAVAPAAQGSRPGPEGIAA